MRQHDMGWADTWLNTGILFFTFLGVMIPLHQANKKRAEDQVKQLDRIENTLKKHDKRTRKTRQLAAGVLERLHRLETGKHPMTGDFR